MKRLFVIALPLLVFTSCETKMTDQADKAKQRELAEAKQACDNGQCPCSTPLGLVKHGSKAPAYTQSSAPCEQNCEQYRVMLTCNNGEFDRDVEGLFFTCDVEPCPACFIGNNLILSGESVDTWNTAQVGCRESCADHYLLRECVRGTLVSRPDASVNGEAYTHFRCERKECSCLLPDEAGYITLDGTIELFDREQALCGKTCRGDHMQARTCVSQMSGGQEIFVLNGGSQYRFRECREAENCFCTLPNNLGVLSHNQTKRLTTVATAACGEACVDKPGITVRCVNGTFYDQANPTQVVNFSLPQYEPYRYECSQEDCVSCPVQIESGNSISVPHGQTYRFAKSAAVGCTEECDYRERRCFNGTFLAENPGDANYNAAVCRRRLCTCYPMGPGGPGVPVGNTWDFHSAPAAQCGQSCTEISGPRTCEEVANANGTFTYRFTDHATLTHPSCQPPTGCACLLPGSLGQIAHGKREILTSVSPLPCGQTCEGVDSLEVRCDNGSLVQHSNGLPVEASSPGFPYLYRCEQGNCSGCTLRNYGTIASGNELTLYDKGVLGCSDVLELHTFVFQCLNGVLLRNGAPYDDANAPPEWFTSATINCPGCPFPDGTGHVLAGQQKTFYKHFGTVVNGCGRGCKSQVRTCVDANGTLALDGDPTYNLTSCDNSCNMEGVGAPPRLCLLRWQNSYVTPDAQIPIWSKREVACGDSCQNYFSLGRCEMETGAFDLPFDFMYPACTELCQ